jgi:hypothetical protein
MFFAEAQIRVHLYGQPTDMRKYAGRSVMLSWWWWSSVPMERSDISSLHNEPSVCPY